MGADCHCVSSEGACGAELPRSSTGRAPMQRRMVRSGNPHSLTHGFGQRPECSSPFSSFRHPLYSPRRGIPRRRYLRRAHDRPWIARHLARIGRTRTDEAPAYESHNPCAHTSRRSPKRNPVASARGRYPRAHGQSNRGCDFRPPATVILVSLRAAKKGKSYNKEMGRIAREGQYLVFESPCFYSELIRRTEYLPAIRD